MIHSYEVHWNGSIGDKCYTTFPVTSTELTEPHFLELRQRRLTSTGHKRWCNESLPTQYIVDRRNQLWELRKGNFKKVPKYDWKLSRKQIGMIKIGTFSRKLTHYEKKPPPRTTLLAILNRNRDNLEELMDLREKGSGNIVVGIGQVLGTTISALASGGSQIIRAVGAGIKDTLSGISDLDEGLVDSIGNATSKVVKAGTKGIADILAPFGGISSIILYILVFILYLYLIYDKIGRVAGCASLMVAKARGKRPADDESVNRDPSTSLLRGTRQDDTHLFSRKLSPVYRNRGQSGSSGSGSYIPNPANQIMVPNRDSKLVMSTHSESTEPSEGDPPSPIPPPKPFLKRSQPRDIPYAKGRKRASPYPSPPTPATDFFTNPQPISLQANGTTRQRRASESPIYASA